MVTDNGEQGNGGEGKAKGGAEEKS